MRAALIGSGGPVLGREYMLDQPVVTIGRRDENTVVIKDPTVSRKHAEIRRQGDDFLIVDKDSTSGVLVNGQSITGEQRLRDGDRIGIGTSAVFLVQLQPAEERTVSFSQAELGDQNRTQFITRTELEDPRAVPAEPTSASSPAERPAPAPQAFEPAPRPVPPPTADPPPFTPPPTRNPAPPLAPTSSLTPAFEPDSTQAWSSSAASPPPPTFSAAPEVPRFGNDAPAQPSFAPPPANPGAGGFGAQGGGQSFAPPPAPNFSPPPPGPSFSPPPPGGAPQQFGAPSQASAPRSSSRAGLIIGLVVLLLLLIVAAVVVFLLLSGRLGG